MKFKNQAAALKAIIKERGLSARALAETLGVSEVYVSHMVNGKSGIPASRAYLFGAKDLGFIKAAAVADFKDAWQDEVRKGLQALSTSDKAGRHEKQKAKKEKSKTKNRQL